MSKDTSKVGSNIDAWCTKCKLVLAHTIEAVALGVIKRVHCNTCGGKHQFKASEPGVKAPSKAKASTAPKNKSKASDFSRLVSGKDLTRAIPYKTTRRFSKGELMNHSTFGVGVVVDEKDMSKIEVLFEAGPKVLIHARG